ncbi:MAG: hypothetical protein AB1659_12280 [Thermodesulfobacteriota bacterium]
MSMITRFLIALAVLAIDFMVFFIPLSAVFLAYIIISNPLWFRRFLERLEKPAESA